MIMKGDNDMKTFFSVLIGAALFSACAAKQKPIAYYVTVVSATLPSEKAPGVPWDKPEKDGGFLSGLCKVGILLGAAAITVGSSGTAAAAAPSIAAIAQDKCNLLNKEGDPAVTLPDPYIEVIVEEKKYIIPPKGNTIKPLWNETVEVEYKENLSLIVAVYDNDGKDGELIGTGKFKPGDQKDEPFDIDCEGALVTLEVKPIFEDTSKAKTE